MKLPSVIVIVVERSIPDISYAVILKLILCRSAENCGKTFGISTEETRTDITFL